MTAVAPVTEPVELLPAALVGLFGGTLVGMTGVGAGSVIAAGLLLVFPDMAPKLIVGSATLQAVAMKLVAVVMRRRYRFREGALGLAMAAGAIPMAAAGAWACSRIDADTLRQVVASVLLVVGLILVAQAVPRAPAQDEAPAPPRAGAPDPPRAAPEAPDPPGGLVGAVGALVGFIAGLTSIGTGTLFVSALAGPLKMDAHRAVAVALLAGLMTLVVSGATHAMLGHVLPALVAGTLLGSVPGVLLGTLAARRLSSVALRGTIGAGIAVAAVISLARLGR